MDRSLSLRSPSEKYVSNWTRVPRDVAPDNSARALPRSSYRALSSTRCFAPESTPGDRAGWTRRLLRSRGGGLGSTSDGGGESKSYLYTEVCSGLGLGFHPRPMRRP